MRFRFTARPLRRWTDFLAATCGPVAMPMVWFLTGCGFTAALHSKSVTELAHQAGIVAVTVSATVAFMWKGVKGIYTVLAETNKAYSETSKAYKELADSTKALKLTMEQELAECKADRERLWEADQEKTERIRRQDEALTGAWSMIQEVQSQLLALQKNGQVQH